MIRRKARFVAAIVTMTALASCGAAPPQPPAAEAVAVGDPGYVSPPALTEASPAAGVVMLAGSAPPGARVRLASPAGGVLDAQADDKGRWRLRLPLHAEARIYGLSAEAAGRKVQAQGYVFVGPAGETALLRAGAAARRLDHEAGARIAAVDFDAEGGALVSGWAAAGTNVAIRLDGRALGQVRTDADGRFSYAMPRLAQGVRSIGASGVGFSDEIQVEVSPPAALTTGPLVTRPAGRGVRADWLTPGGGVQSTVLAG